MSKPFSSFVILADMRTGSNFLEERLAGMLRVACHGELFNPIFVGRKGQMEAFGMSLKEREFDPDALLERMRGASAELSGFRLFPGHDGRIEARVLKDRSCAKIILSRNPLDSFISLKAARATGQWRITGERPARTAQVRFDPAEFESYLAERRVFYDRVARVLKSTGQTGFHLDYDDLGDDVVIAGIGKYLGAGLREPPLPSTARVQNPEPLIERVSNPEALLAAAGRLDLLDSTRIPEFEPGRGANVTRWLVSDDPPLLYIPLPGGPGERVATWLGGGHSAPRTGLTRKEIRQWKRRNPDHRCFSVVVHPLLRAHRAFARHVLQDRPSSFQEIRRVLATTWEVDLSEAAVLDREGYASAFKGFLRFLKANLGGQTAVRVPAAWASQDTLLRAAAGFAVPDRVLREAELERGEAFGLAPVGENATDSRNDAILASILDEDIENAARRAYSRDYMAFGFGRLGA